MKIFFTTEAEEDVVDILEYMSIKNVELVRKISGQIQYTCNLLGSMPEIGVSVSSIIEVVDFSSEIKKIFKGKNIIGSIRKFPVVDFEKVLLFYKVEKDKLTITRVLHSRRDIPSLMQKYETS